MFFFFFKQKTAYELRISDWSSDVCSSDLGLGDAELTLACLGHQLAQGLGQVLRREDRGEEGVEVGRVLDQTERAGEVGAPLAPEAVEGRVEQGRQDRKSVV